MTEIRLRAEEARQMAQRVKSEASDAQGRIASLRGYLGGLKDNFTGQAATAFDGAYDSWHNGAEQMIEGLDGLGKFLENAATTIEDTDQKIAQQLQT